MIVNCFLPPAIKLHVSCLVYVQSKNNLIQLTELHMFYDRSLREYFDKGGRGGLVRAC